MAKMKKPGEKVLLIGIDGMDPKITNKLIVEGKLPNFQKLKEKGYYSELSTSYPPHSPVAWASIATGRNPGKHNIFDFIRRNPENYMPELSLAKSKSGIGGTDYISYVKTDSFWKIISEAGIPTTVIRWPLTFPPEKVEGNLLAGLGVPDVKGFLTGYTFYNEKEDGEKSIKELDVMAVIRREVDRLFEKIAKKQPKESNGQKVIALLGGTGVGKTTTLMKMASNPDFYGKINVGIISIDTYRAGAMAPLEAFSKIAGIPVSEARSVEEAREKLLELKDKDVVFIDTPGRGLYFENYMKELNQYLTVLNPTEILLVLASNTDIDDIFLTAGIATIQKLTGLAITKFDETGKPGKALSVMKEINIPIQMICDGQSVPKNICLGNTDNLWNKIFNGKG